MSKFGFTSAAAAAAVTLIAGAASAAPPPVTGSDSVIIGTTTTSGGLDIAGTVAAGDTFNFSFLLFGTGAGDFAGVPFLTPINDTFLTNTPGGLGSFSLVSTAGTAGFFTGAPSVTPNLITLYSQLVSLTGSQASGTETVSYYLVGDYTPGVLEGGTDNNASLTLSITETGSDATHLGSFSASLTLAAPAASPPGPPPTDTPEPASMALLGFGLLGLGAVRRRMRRT